MPDNGEPVDQRTAMALIASHHAVETARRSRARAARAALDAGHSTRTLASVLGVGHNSVARWARDGR